jgi:hypothetical protein
MQTRWPINWVLMSALLALVLGLILEPVALEANDQPLRRAALLLIVYGIAITWVQTRTVVAVWWRRAVRALHSWLSGRKHISRETQ